MRSMMCPPALALVCLWASLGLGGGKMVEAAEVRVGVGEPVNQPFPVLPKMERLSDRREKPVPYPQQDNQEQPWGNLHLQQPNQKVKMDIFQQQANLQPLNQQVQENQQQQANMLSAKQLGQGIKLPVDYKQIQQQNVNSFVKQGGWMKGNIAQAAPRPGAQMDPAPQQGTVNRMEELNKQRVEEQRVAQESAFRQQELHRQEQQERVRQQQDTIRRQLEEQQQAQLQQHQQELQRQRQQSGINNVNANMDSMRQNGEQARRSEIKTPAPQPAWKQSADDGSHFDGKVDRPDNEHQQEDHAQNGQENFANPVENNGNEDVQRDRLREGEREWESNMNKVPVQRDPPEEPIRDIGGMRINWDWDDFSISFDNYGAAEMKVRRAHHASTGEPWPLPQYYTKKDKNILVVDPDFQFDVISNISCDVIDQALDRYKTRIVQFSMEDMYDNLQNAAGTYLDSPEAKYRSALYQKAPVIFKFSLKIRKPCTVFPSMESDESYDLVIKKTAAYLWANEVWGLLRGLETLSQLIWRGPDDRLYVKESVISDYPRFPHRGILIDSSRHFIYKEVLYDMMDAMEMNKMNVVHWHIVDDQSFPYESQVFPELSGKGAYHPSYVYSLQDIADLLEYARVRGIRILPEFDSPGHTYSWGLSRPELLTQCYSGNSPVKGYLGPVDPVRNSSYNFLKTLFEEVLHVFKDQFIHLGGDEVPLGCWQSNPDVVKFGDKLSQQSNHPDTDQSNYFGGPSPAIRLVYEYYVTRLMKDIKELGKKRNGVRFIMWQEVMNNDLQLPNDTLIQVWMGDMMDVSKAISKGYDVLYSSCWYLDHVEYGVKWPKYYNCDPADASYGYNIDEKKVKGGEACLWSEYIDNENLVQTTWPRASAVAERLWSSKDIRNLDAAGQRLSEHRCRMLRRGLSVGQVSGPDYCLKRGPGRGGRAKSGCQGSGCRSDTQDTVEEKSDFQVRVRSQSRASSDCTWMLQVGGNITLFVVVIIAAVVIFVSLSRTSGKFNPLRLCRQRTILIIFLAVTVIYFMCFTTMWMHVFEFSGSFRKSRPSSSSS